MADFDPGTKVICLRGRWSPGVNIGPFISLQVGGEYVVRATRIRPNFGLGIALHGVWEFDPYFAVLRNDGTPNFRPVIERKRKTDISIFKKFLVPNRQKETV